MTHPHNMWIEEGKIHWVEDNEVVSVEGEPLGDSGAKPGEYWLEDRHGHFIDGEGVERKLTREDTLKMEAALAETDLPKT